jgi:phospholipid/cholesterol/gamma-HCH transport system substrate-binding protein
MEAGIARMRENNVAETVIGAIVVVIAIAFIDGLGVGTDVRLSGIKIGSISDMTLDPKTYLVILHMNIRDDVKIPDDSSLMVTSSGLLGSSYVSLTPGGSDKMLASGGMIQNSQGSVDLMGLIGRFATQPPPASKPQQPGPSP